ncbi:hypothetical protein [Pseudonocardia sp.]|uniref:hypothetical protein n=1 Tax=Pseudonocardia sp. TaxID=60912 RepID=UPI003D09C9D2
MTHRTTSVIRGLIAVIATGLVAVPGLATLSPAAPALPSGAGVFPPGGRPVGGFVAVLVLAGLRIRRPSPAGGR